MRPYDICLSPTGLSHSERAPFPRKPAAAPLTRRTRTARRADCMEKGPWVLGPESGNLVVEVFYLVFKGVLYFNLRGGGSAAAFPGKGLRAPCGAREARPHSFSHERNASVNASGLKLGTRLAFSACASAFSPRLLCARVRRLSAARLPHGLGS